MITISPRIWIAAACVAAGALLGAGGAWYIQGLKIDALRADFNGFKAGVEAEGKAAAKLAAAKEAKDKQLKKDSDHAYETAISRLRADNQRLRDARARVDPVPEGTGPAGNPSLACFDRAELNAAIQRFDDGISRLIEEGDKNAVGLNVARRWAAGIGSGNPATIPP